MEANSARVSRWTGEGVSLVLVEDLSNKMQVYVSWSNQEKSCVKDTHVEHYAAHNKSGYFCNYFRDNFWAIKAIISYEDPTEEESHFPFPCHFLECKKTSYISAAMFWNARLR